MVVPHLREQVDAAVIALADEVVRGEATGPGDHLFIVDLAQLRDLDLLQLADQVADSYLPLSVELVPVLVVVTRGRWKISNRRWISSGSVTGFAVM